MDSKSEARMTWEQMVSIEPDLEILRNECKLDEFSWPRYEAMKRKLSHLVGWGPSLVAHNRRMPKEELSTCDAWNTAIDTILNGWEP